MKCIKYKGESYTEIDKRTYKGVTAYQVRKLGTEAFWIVQDGKTFGTYADVKRYINTKEVQPMRRSEELMAKGYTMNGLTYDSKEQAKARAQELRKIGFRATVVEESRRGVYYYFVFRKEV